MHTHNDNQRTLRAFTGDVSDPAATLASFRAFCAAVGRPLEPFQERIAAGFWGDERTLTVIIAKGNAKTEIGALRAVWELLHVAHPFVLIGAAR